MGDFKRKSSTVLFYTVDCITGNFYFLPFIELNAPILEGETEKKIVHLELSNNLLYVSKASTTSFWINSAINNLVRWKINRHIFPPLKDEKKQLTKVYPAPFLNEVSHYFWKKDEKKNFLTLILQFIVIFAVYLYVTRQILFRQNAWQYSVCNM